MFQQFRNGEILLSSDLRTAQHNTQSQSEDDSIGLPSQKDIKDKEDEIEDKTLNRISLQVVAFAEDEINDINDHEINRILIEILQQGYHDGKLRKDNALDKKISHYLKLPALAPVEFEIVKNLIKFREKQREIYAGE